MRGKIRNDWIITHMVYFYFMDVEYKKTAEELKQERDHAIQQLHDLGTSQQVLSSFAHVRLGGTYRSCMDLLKNKLFIPL